MKNVYIMLSVVFALIVLLNNSVAQTFSVFKHNQLESWGDCGRGEFATACIEDERKWREAQAEALKLRDQRREKQIASYAQKLEPEGYKYFVANKGQKRNTLQVRNLHAFRKWYVDIRAFPLVEIDGSMSEVEPNFDVWDTRNGRNRDLSLGVEVYRDTVIESEFWRLKVGNFRSDMIIFYKVVKGGFIAEPVQRDLGCHPKPLTYDEGVMRGCW